MGLAAAGSFVIAPSLGLVLWATFMLLCVAAGLVTAAKGGRGWLILAFFFTAGIGRLLTAWIRADPASLWAGRSRRYAPIADSGTA